MRNAHEVSVRTLKLSVCEQRESFWRCRENQCTRSSDCMSGSGFWPRPNSSEEWFQTRSWGIDGVLGRHNLRTNVTFLWTDLFVVSSHKRSSCWFANRAKFQIWLEFQLGVCNIAPEIDSVQLPVTQAQKRHEEHQRRDFKNLKHLTIHVVSLVVAARLSPRHLYSFLEHTESRVWNMFTCEHLCWPERTICNWSWAWKHDTFQKKRKKYRMFRTGIWTEFGMGVTFSVHAVLFKKAKRREASRTSLPCWFFIGWRRSRCGCTHQHQSRWNLYVHAWMWPRNCSHGTISSVAFLLVQQKNSCRLCRCHCRRATRNLGMIQTRRLLEKHKGTFAPPLRATPINTIAKIFWLVCRFQLNLLSYICETKTQQGDTREKSHERRIIGKIARGKDSRESWVEHNSVQDHQSETFWIPCIATSSPRGQFSLSKKAVDCSTHQQHAGTQNNIQASKVLVFDACLCLRFKNYSYDWLIWAAATILTVLVDHTHPFISFVKASVSDELFTTEIYENNTNSVQTTCLLWRPEDTLNAIAFVPVLVKKGRFYFACMDANAFVRTSFLDSIDVWLVWVLTMASSAAVVLVKSPYAYAPFTTCVVRIGKFIVIELTAQRTRWNNSDCRRGKERQ